MWKEKPPKYSHEKLKAMRDPKGHSACSAACTQRKKSGIAASTHPSAKLLPTCDQSLVLVRPDLVLSPWSRLDLPTVVSSSRTEFILIDYKSSLAKSSSVW